MKETIEYFYRENPGNWRASYPGLSVRRLVSEYEHFIGHFQSHYTAHQHQERNQTIWQCFKQLLLDGVPLQYISHQSYFYNSEFYVDERVLIPRSETELLVEKAISLIENHKKENILIAEVGVGPGTIALSLLQEVKKKSVTYFASDISSDALEVFKINLFKLGFKISKKHKVEFRQADRLYDFKEKVDIILSNPPYIKRKNDQGLVHHQVLLHEPHEALFLDDEEYDTWYECFFEQCYQSLHNGGELLIEGHESHLRDLLKKAEAIFNSSGRIEQDLSGRDRLLSLRKENG